MSTTPTDSTTAQTTRVQMLTPQEVRQFSQTSGLNTWKAIFLDWGVIGLIFYLGACFSHLSLSTSFSSYFPAFICLPLIYLPLMMLMARQQLALGLLMHDATHGRLFKSRFWNDVICQFFCSGPLFFSLYSYRNSHLKHHLDPLVPDDPDITLTGGYPISGRSFARKLFRDVSGISYFKFIKYFVYRTHNRTPRGAEPEAGTAVKKKAHSESNLLSLRVVIFSMLLSNLVLFGILALLGHPGLYFLLWALPSMTFLQVYLRIRGIAEHAGYHPNPDQRLNSRTVVNPVQTFLWAPHCVNYHVEHHIYPSVPYFRLPKVHRLLAARGALPKENVYYSYVQVIRDLVK